MTSLNYEQRNAQHVYGMNDRDVWVSRMRHNLMMKGCDWVSCHNYYTSFLIIDINFYFYFS
jgi:hypothetical protein